MNIVRPILVTGAAGRLGAVGRTVVQILLQRGLPVRALVRRTYVVSAVIALYLNVFVLIVQLFERCKG